MNKHIVIVDDRLEKLVALRQRLEETRGERSEQEHEAALTKLTWMEQSERTYRETRAEVRQKAEAYNRATPEQRLLLVKEWAAQSRKQTDQTV